MGKISKPLPQCLLVEFDTKKDMALTFCRIQEYYESDKEPLRGQLFSFYDFVVEHMDDRGRINYFNHWDGYNFHDQVFKKWLPWDRTVHENKLLDHMEAELNWDQPFYVIGSLEGDKGTIKHELAHALWYLNTDYRMRAEILVHDIKKYYPYEYRRFTTELREMGYAEAVLHDEMQAYMATGDIKDLRGFGCDIPNFRERFKHNLRSYLE